MQKPSVPQLGPPWSAHRDKRSAPPSGMLEQVPRDVVSAQDLQMPWQVVWQQTPCSQFPERHSSLFPQTAPFGCRPQDPFTHAAGGRHWAFDVHEAKQALVSQAYGKHDVVAGVMQVPAPLQVESGVDALVVVGQVASMHGVPEAHFWHAPASHLPLVPQVDMACIWQMLAGSSAPVGTFVQVPSIPTMHDLQAVSQAVSQQTPWAQCRLRHSSSAEQEAPKSLGPHRLVVQLLGDTHWLSAVQAVKHRVPLHLYGLQATGSCTTHCPEALHVAGAV